MKQGHSNVNSGETQPYPTNPEVALIPIAGGRSPYTVRELPPLALQYDEWLTIGRRMNWLAGKKETR